MAAIAGRRWMKLGHQLTCLTLGHPSGPAYLTGELLNTPLLL